LSSSPLISPAFFTTLGICLWRLILRISGMCAYRSERASLYSNACLCFALLIPSRFEAFARHSLIFPSSEPESTNRESYIGKTQSQFYSFPDLRGHIGFGPHAPRFPKKKTFSMRSGTYRCPLAGEDSLHPLCVVYISAVTFTSVP
jgi:hypothetical protein